MKDNSKSNSSMETAENRTILSQRDPYIYTKSTRIPTTNTKKSKAILSTSKTISNSSSAAKLIPDMMQSVTSEVVLVTVITANETTEELEEYESGEVRNFTEKPNLVLGSPSEHQKVSKIYVNYSNILY